MATVSFVLAQTALSAPVVRAAARVGEEITSSATSQQTAAAADHHEYWVVSALGGPVWLTFGDNPVAAPGSTWLLLDGETRDFAADAGQKAAVIDAA